MLSLSGFELYSCWVPLDKYIHNVKACVSPFKDNPRLAHI